MNTENLRELTFDEVKSWVQSQEMSQNIEINWSKINKLCKYFYPGATKLILQLGGEWDDSGYDLAIKEVSAFNKDGEEILCPDFEEFGSEYGNLILMERSKYKELYSEWGNFTRNFPLSIDEIYFDIKIGCVDFNTQVASSEFTSSVIFNIENQTIEGPAIQKIYGEREYFAG